MTNPDQVALIQELKKVKGALPYDGDVSTQVLLPTKEGKYLRVGITDEDVATHKGIWFDYYEGFNGEIKKAAQQTLREYDLDEWFDNWWLKLIK